MSTENNNYGVVIDDQNVVSNVVRSRPTPQMSLARYLFDHLDQAPDQLLFIDQNKRSKTRGQVKLDVIKMARAFLSWGFKDGDRLCVFAPNSIVHINVQLAAFATNVCYSGCHHKYAARELEHILTIAKPYALFICYDTYEMAMKILGNHDYLKYVVNLDNNENDVRRLDNGKIVMSLGSFMKNGETSTLEVPVALKQDSRLVNAAITFSSGSTGIPKGVPRSHFNQLAYCTMLDQWPIVGPPGGVISLTIMMHASGFMLIQSVIVAKLTAIVDPAPGPLEFLKSIEDYNVTVAMVSPNTLIGVSKLPADVVAKFDTSSLNYVTTGGACLPDTVKLPIKEMLSLDTLCQCYGSTEAMVSISSLLGFQDMNTLGLPVPGVEVRVVDPETGLNLGPGSVGEVQLRGDLVTRGYLDNTEANAAAFTQDGFYKTGDAMYYDERGHFYIVDRYKEVMKVGGKQVAPAELESILLSHDSVQAAAVVGVAHDVLGHIPLAYVVVKTGTEPTDGLRQRLIDHVKSQVADQKQLRGGLRFVDKLPLISIGKIDRTALKRMALEL